MKRSAEGNLFTEIVLEVFKLNGLLVTAGDELSKELGLTSARWKVLGALAYSLIPMTVPQIAHTMGQTRQSVQRLTDVMVKDRILKYQTNPLHKKAKLVALTSKGQKIYDLLDQKQVPWANSITSDLDAIDMETALNVLRKTTQKLDT